MREKKTPAQRLKEGLRRSVTRVNPKAKKGLKAVLRARGLGKKEIRARTKKAAAPAKPIPPKEQTLMDKTVRIVNIGKQFRRTR